MKWFLLLISLLFSALHAETENWERLQSYIQNEHYESAKELLETTVFDSTFQDSVSLQKISLYHSTKDWKKAIDSAKDILVSSENDSLQQAITPIFKQLLSHLSPSVSIEYLTQVIRQTNHAEIRHELLLKLASVYERNHLFGEAKDVYFVLLNDSTQVDTMTIFLNIIQSELSLHNFSRAKQIIDSLEVKADSLYHADLQFLKFIAFYSENKTETAKKILLKLYLQYPDYKNRTEIIETLAEIYNDEKQYLLSWYFLNQLYEISSAYKKMILLNTIQDVKKSLVNDSLGTEQFKFFRPVFEEINEKER